MSLCDWSSDVCSSDLVKVPVKVIAENEPAPAPVEEVPAEAPVTEDEDFEEELEEATEA